MTHSDTFATRKAVTWAAPQGVTRLTAGKEKTGSHYLYNFRFLAHFYKDEDAHFL